MHLTSPQISSMTESSLRELLALAIEEGPYLDYKQALSGETDKEAKREFLKDVTAFANAAGGHLFLGIKEPAAGATADDQLVGLEAADALARDLERIAASSIDPRIPGLLIAPIPLASGKSCLVVHVPPSLRRPHMVTHAGHRSFYVRHSESSVPMTTHEIREAVLTSASAEGKARLFVERRLAEIREEIGEQVPAFFLQAMPLIALESPWDVLSAPFEEVIRGNARRTKYHHYATFATDMTPRPTIDGLLGHDLREPPSWGIEVHRTGYVSLLYQDVLYHPVHGEKRPVLHPGKCDIFHSFCDILKELLVVSGSDVPYLIGCVYLNAQATCFWKEAGRWHEFSEPYGKKSILWPEHIRPTGTDPMLVAKDLCLRLFNAFGMKQVIEPPR
jgi:hypothetical protein